MADFHSVAGAAMASMCMLGVCFLWLYGDVPLGPGGPRPPLQFLRRPLLSHSPLNATAARSHLKAAAVHSHLNAPAARSPLNATAARSHLNATAGRRRTPKSVEALLRRVVVVIPSAPRAGSSTLLRDVLRSFAAALPTPGLDVRVLVFDMAFAGERHAAFEVARMEASGENIEFVAKRPYGPYERPDDFLQNWDSPGHAIGTTPATRKQSADFANALWFAAHREPEADVLLWEDDCLFCPETFRLVARFLEAVNGSGYGMLKMGYGGSGHLVQRARVLQLAEFVFAQSYWTFVDISIHRFLSFHRYPSYATEKAMALHKGVHSTFPNKGAWTGDVGCDRGLDIYWGSFAACAAPALAVLGVRCVDSWLF